MLKDRKTVLVASTFLILGLIVGYSITEVLNHQRQKLPHDLQKQLIRFKFINQSTNETIFSYKVIGVQKGTYQTEEVFETYVIGFEDRYGGATADLDYLDLIIEIKRRVGGEQFTVRIVQLGLDAIDVYLDENYLGTVRPSLEFEVKY
ncbi:MAG: hypothetical protein QXJ17_02200 [Nitrososphaeria archaeon]